MNYRYKNGKVHAGGRNRKSSWVYLWCGPVAWLGVDVKKTSDPATCKNCIKVLKKWGWL